MAFGLESGFPGPARWPGVGPQRCKAAQLVPSGARSQQGRPLFWRDIHTPASVQTTAGNALAPLRVLVVGAIHGDELTSASLALHWIGLAEKMQTMGQAVHWRFIPVLNPDGFLAKKPSRVNARGVDLNRNFNTPQWQRDAPIYWEKRTRKDPRRWAPVARRGTAARRCRAGAAKTRRKRWRQLPGWPDWPALARWTLRPAPHCQATTAAPPLPGA